LIVKLINKIDGKKFKEAVKLGDENSKTLGFLPEEAFKKYAKLNQIFGAFDKITNELCGYLLYRISYNKVNIVHCSKPLEQQIKKQWLTLKSQKLTNDQSQIICFRNRTRTVMYRFRVL